MGNNVISLVELNKAVFTSFPSFLCKTRPHIMYSSKVSESMQKI